MFKKPECDNCLTRTKSCFVHLLNEDILELNENKVCNLYKKGQNIFYEYSKPTGIFCLNEGKIKITKIGIDGKEHIVRIVMAGDLFGVRALIGGRNYASSSTAIEDSIVCYLNKNTFLKFIIKYPQMAHSLMTYLSHLLEESDYKMGSLALKPVRERLAESLLFLNNKFKPDFDIENQFTHQINSLSREELANLIGTATETVIRLLSEFKKDKLIAIEGRKIFLLDIPKLKKAANIFE